MNKRTSLFYLFLGIAITLLSACASVPLAPPETDLKAKTMSPPPDKALVYLYRNEIMGSAIKMTVNLDGRYAGQTASKTYFMWLLDPGKHDLTSVTEDTSNLSIDAKAGETYYVWQEVKMGMWSARSNLQLVDKQTGRKGVEDSKLIQGL